MGPERSTFGSQAAYLTDLSVKFQSWMAKAIDGKFISDSAFDQESALRLATAVNIRMETYDKNLRAHGHSHVFGKSALSTGDEEEDLHSGPSKGISTRTTNDVAELMDILYPSEAALHDDEDILSWLTNTYKACRGFELGTFEPSILASIMKQQSSNWTSISLGFVSGVIVLVHQCIRTALEHVVPDKHVRSRLFGVLLDGLVEGYKPAISHTLFLLSVERDGIPLTTNHYFNDNLQRS